MLAVLLAPTQRVEAAVPADFFGVNAQGLFYEPAERWDAQLSLMASGGLEVVRSDASWDGVEPQPPDPASGQHSYQWAKLDAQVAALSRHGLRWYPILDYSAPWAAAAPGDPFSPPSQPADYVAWTRALAGRYGRGGSFWADHPELRPLPVVAYEVWNEENAGHFWHPQAAAPEAYADLYLATWTAIRAVDPAAGVVVGGLALTNTDVTDPAEFLRRMYAHRPELRGNVDAVAYHPYAPTVGGVEATVRDFRRALDSLGAGDVPIEITEVGWPTPQYSETARAADLAQLARDLPRSGCGIGSFLPHTWLEPNSPAESFGIVNDDATPMPSGAAYLDAVRQMRDLGGAPPSSHVPICHPGAPSLELRVLQDRRPPARLTVLARCPKGCRLQVVLLARRRSGAGAIRITHRRTAFTKRRQAVRLTVPDAVRRRTTRLRLNVHAIDRAGRRTTRSRSIATR